MKTTAERRHASRTWSFGLLFVAGAAVTWEAVAWAQSKPSKATTQPATPSQERLEAVRDWHRYVAEHVKSGAMGEGDPSPEQRFVWSQRLMRCEIDAATDDGGRSGAKRDHVTRMKRMLDFSEAAYRSGECTMVDVAAARFYYADARIVAEEKSNP